MPPIAMSREEERQAIRDRIFRLLAQHGRNALQDGDYYLVDTDDGTYEQRVLVLCRDVFTLEVLMAVSDVLWDYSRKWRVSLIGANKDGTEMRPPAGLKISAYGPEPLQPVKASPKEESETRALYAALSQLLSVRGSSNPFGEGDYWIVDDSWVPRSHKVCIFDIEFLTPKLVDEVQQLLKERFSQCEVWFQIEVDNPNVKIPLSGIRVFAERIEHDWDRERLRSIFNEKFAW